MEDVLETYAKAYDPQHPVLCMDEQPVQLLQETRVPIAATKQHGKRVDYEYERNGTASIFMFAEPLSGFRQATARARRTKADWAIEVAQLLDTRYTDGEYVTLVCDNLNTHTKGAFYEAFEPDRARAYMKRIKFCYTPKHGIDLQKMNWKFRTGFQEHTGVSLTAHLPNNSMGGYTRVHQDTAQSRHRQRSAQPSATRLSAR
jgi:hypothetical protein